MLALRFLYKKTLKRRDIAYDDLIFPKTPRKLPVVLSLDEVARMIEAAPDCSDPTSALRHQVGSPLGANTKRRIEVGTPIFCAVSNHQSAAANVTDVAHRITRDQH
jgi:hypothetical protein